MNTSAFKLTTIGLIRHIMVQLLQSLEIQREISLFQLELVQCSAVFQYLNYKQKRSSFDF